MLPIISLSPIHRTNAGTSAKREDQQIVILYYPYLTLAVKGSERQTHRRPLRLFDLCDGLEPYSPQYLLMLVLIELRKRTMMWNATNFEMVGNRRNSKVPLISQ